MHSPRSSWLDAIIHKDQVESTMDEVRTLAAAGAPEGTTVVADHQTRGRGRRGRTWVSGEGAGLWMTTLLRPTGPKEALPQLGLVAGAAVLAAVHQAGATSTTLKWPNDIMQGPKKLAGILLEAEDLHTEAPRILIGVGLNLAPAHTRTLPAEVQERYIGLHELSQSNEHSSLPLLHSILHHLEEGCRQWRNQGLAPTLNFWNQHDWLKGHRVQATAEQGDIHGEYLGLTPLGELRMRTPRGEVTIRSGEVIRVNPQPPEGRSKPT